MGLPGVAYIPAASGRR